VLLVFVLLTGLFVLKANSERASFSGAVYIRADGSIDPPDAPIYRNGDLYTLTGNITSNSDGVRIERDDMVLDGAGFSVQGFGGSMGIALYDRSNVTIEDIEVTTFLWGVYVSTSSNISLVSNNVTNNNDGILFIWASTDNSIVGNNITDNTRTGVYLFGRSDNNTITGNRFVNDGMFVSDSYGNVVETNVVNEKPLVYLEGASSLTVVNAGQVILVNCDNVEVDSLNLVNASVGLELLRTNNSRTADNNIINNGRYGLYLSHSFNNSAVRNVIAKNGEHGISLSDSLNNTVAGNNISQNEAYGIHLEFSLSNTIVGNNVTENGYGGIGVESSSSNNSISENCLLANGYVGIKLGYSSGNNNIDTNNITDNGIGVAFDASSLSKVTGNTFTADGLWSQDSYGNMVENNTINGKPLVYLEERSDYVINDAGQVLLINCSNIRVENLDLSNTVVGLQLSGTNNSRILNSTIAGNGVTSNNRFGIWSLYSSNNSMIGNNIQRKWYGIYLDNSLNSTILGNTIAENEEGIILDMASDYSRISGNNVTGNGYGIDLANSQFSRIFDNIVSRNRRGIYVSSNNNVYGNDISENNETGVIVTGFYNNLSENNITGNNGSGIWIFESNGNTIVKNSLVNNTYGITLSSTTPARPLGLEYNTISENNITANQYAGIALNHSSYGRIYHNNFVNNVEQAIVEDSPNSVWDDGYPSGGNYWSDYVGIDSDQNGLGDISYIINMTDQDHFPLMGMFHSYDVSYVEQGLTLNLISNSTISNLDVLVSIEHLEKRTISFDATGQSGVGFVRICIPHALMNESYRVTVNGQDPHYVNYTLYDNGTHRWIYFDYLTSTRRIVIVPEFSSLLVLLMFSIATSLVIILKKRIRHRRASVQTVRLSESISCLASVGGCPE
jgi:parallel beta-helix repeat protein